MRPKYAHRYSIEIVPSDCKTAKPKWEEMTSIASQFDKRRKALDFLFREDTHLNRIETRFFLVTFRKHGPGRPVRIVEI